jgi:hypothetical protein
MMYITTKVSATWASIGRSRGLKYMALSWFVVVGTYISRRTATQLISVTNYPLSGNIPFGQVSPASEVGTIGM